MKKTLIRGTIIAALGLIPMLYATLYIRAPALSFWGIPIFFASLSLIAVGMVPFRRLSFLENNPNKLTILNDNHLIYFHKGKKTLTIPFSAIDKIKYFDEDSAYGISLFLHKDPEEKIIVHNRGFDFKRYQNTSRRYYHCDLFLPYFSKRAFKELIEIQD